MASIRLTYHHRLFLLLLSFSWVIIACFLFFQFNREKQFKAQMLNQNLQIYNQSLIDAVANGNDIHAFIETSKKPLDDLRVTVIDSTGQVIFDNSLDKLPLSNHLSRPEIAQAIADGSGLSVRRHSETTDQTYFYSAMAAGGLIVRSAAPYGVSLSDMLNADKSFLWFMIAVTVVMSIIAWLVTQRIGTTISRLSNFAQKAERGEMIYADEAFPPDELGEISAHIVNLYSRLQATMADRDLQHKESLKQEQEKIRIKKMLTNNINHELKTPIAAIQLCIETLEQHPGIDESKRMEIIGKCSANIRRLNSLLGDVSTLTRLDDGRDVITKEPIVLNDVIQEVVAEFSHDKDLPIFVDLKHRFDIVGNKQLWASVFHNLIVNANAYSGGSKIVIESREPGVITFYDDGIGIPEEHIEHIFERFYRIDKGRSREKGGTGLGLAIVKNAVTFHGGKITASNRADGGLQFNIALS